MARMISLFRKGLIFASVSFCKNKTLAIRFYFSIGRAHHMPSLGNYSWVLILDGWLRMGLPPPLGNYADISYLVEN